MKTGNFKSKVNARRIKAHFNLKTKELEYKNVINKNNERLKEIIKQLGDTKDINLIKSLDNEKEELRIRIKAIENEMLYFPKQIKILEERIMTPEVSASLRTKGPGSERRRKQKS